MLMNICLLPALKDVYFLNQRPPPAPVGKSDAPNLIAETEFAAAIELIVLHLK